MAESIMIVYLLGTTMIGLYAARRNKNIQEFLVAKRNLGFVLVGALLFGEMISGAATVGKATEAFKSGLSAVWINWGMVLGCWLFIWLGLSKFFRVFGAQRGAMSVPEAYKFMFDRRTSIVMMIILVVVYSIMFALQPLAAANILGPMFGVETTKMAVIVGIVLITVALTGGLKGIAWMNLVHASVMIVGLLAVTWAAINHAGGWSAITAALPAEYLSFAEPDLLTVFAWAFGTAVSFFCAASTAGVAFGAKSDKDASKGIFLAGLVILGYAILPALIGLAAKVAYPAMKPSIALFGMANAISPLMGGIASMAVIAAIFSTAPALLLIVATVLTRDYYKGLLKPEATEKEQLIFSRVAVVCVGVLGVYFGLKATSILHTALGAFQIRAFAGLVLAIALFWPRVTKEAAFWSISVGGLMAAIWHFIGNPFGVQPLWPSMGFGLLILSVLTLLSKEPVSPGYRRYQEALAEHNKQNAEKAAAGELMKSKLIATR